MPKPIVIDDNRKDLGSRGYFELRGQSWRPVSWSALKKIAETERGSRAAKVHIELRPAKDGKWLPWKQDFGLDAVGALKTAKELIRIGEADTVWVDAIYYRPFRSDGRGSTTHNLFLVEAE